MRFLMLLKKHALSMMVKLILTLTKIFMLSVNVANLLISETLMQLLRADQLNTQIYINFLYHYAGALASANISLNMCSNIKSQLACHGFTLALTTLFR